MNKKRTKNFMVGAFILAAGGIFSKFLGIFFKVPLSATIGDYGLGLYSCAYPLYNTFLSLSTIGLPLAVSKLVSEKATAGNYKGAYKVFYVALATLALMGAISSVIMFAGAKFFIAVFDWDSNAYYSIVAISAAPLFVAVISACRGFFQGMQAMSFSSLSQILEQMGRVAVGVTLAVFFTDRYNVALGAAGATFGATAGAVIAFIFLYVSFLVVRHKQSYMIHAQTMNANDTTKVILRTLVMIAVPIACGGLLNTIMELINSATIPMSLGRAGFDVKQTMDLFGLLEQKAQTLVNVPLVIGSALSASLVPSISTSFQRNDKAKIVQKASLAMRVSFLVSAPSAVGLSVLSQPIIELLFPGSNPQTYTLLSILAFIVIFSVGMVTMQGILQGAGRFYKPLKNMAIGAALKLIMNFVLVSNPNIGINGAVISSITASTLIFLLNANDVRRFIGFENILTNLLKTVLMAAIMGIICHVTYHALAVRVDFRVALILSVFIGVVIYFTGIFSTKIFTRDDFSKVRE